MLQWDFRQWNKIRWHLLVYFIWLETYIECRKKSTHFHQNEAHAHTHTYRGRIETGRDYSLTWSHSKRCLSFIIFRIIYYYNFPLWSSFYGFPITQPAECSIFVVILLCGKEQKYAFRGIDTTAIPEIHHQKKISSTTTNQLTHPANQWLDDAFFCHPSKCTSSPECKSKRYNYPIEWDLRRKCILPLHRMLLIHNTPWAVLSMRWRTEFA